MEPYRNFDLEKIIIVKSHKCRVVDVDPNGH